VTTGPPDIRRATRAELDALTETISLAFHDDPTWSWAFPDEARRQEQYSVFWRFMIGCALRYPWVLRTPGYEAVAVWIPPGGTELAEADEEQLEPLLETLVGGRTAEVVELFARFDAAHPEGPPHYYLSLLGTHPAHRGQRIGMTLLSESLDLIDAEHAPAYLESSNPANNPRYERLGFEAVGEFFPPGPDSGMPVTTMWREAR
jgi:ribosomal protein S18 acetylase RimI-like enzyme